MTNLTCDDIRQTMQSGATLLDVRTSDEFKNGCLPILPLWRARDYGGKNSVQSGL